MVSYEEFIFMQFIPLTILLIFIANAPRDASCVTSHHNIRGAVFNVYCSLCLELRTVYSVFTGLESKLCAFC